MVLTSRVRLARNLADHPFTPRASREDRLAVLARCRDQILTAGLADHLGWIELHKTDGRERQLLAERHLISRQHAKGKLSNGAGGEDEPRAVAMSLPDERLAIMVNEEDHLRLQAIAPGLALAECLDTVDAADDKLEAGLRYAYSARFGYLTACPTNVGTGARFSVMLHLPALRLIGEIDKVRHAADDMGLAVRGFFGEGSDAAGDFHQISNQTTLGKSERLLLREMQSEVIPQIIGYERHARQTLLEASEVQVRDRASRALGVLRYAQMISVDEAMGFLSHVRLGVVLGLIKDVDLSTINELLLFLHPQHLGVLQRGGEDDITRLRESRATLVRDRLREDSRA